MGHAHPPSRAVAIPVAAALLLASCGSPSHVWRGTEYATPPAAPDLKGRTTSGDEGHPTDLTGNVSLVYFGYTNCPDYCPATLAEVAALYDALGDDGDDLTFYFVSVDPQRDSPESLETYLRRFNPRFQGVIVPDEDLPEVLRAYGATAFIEDHNHATSGAVLIAHTTRLFLIDRQGRLRAHYPFDTPAADLAADVAFLLDGR